MDSKAELALGAAWKRVAGLDPCQEVLGTIDGIGFRAGLPLPGRHLEATVYTAVKHSGACLTRFCSVGPELPATLSYPRIVNTTQKDLSVTSARLASLGMPHKPQPLPADPAPAHTSMLLEGQMPLRIW